MLRRPTAAPTASEGSTPPEALARSARWPRIIYTAMAPRFKRVYARLWRVSSRQRERCRSNASGSCSPTPPQSARTTRPAFPPTRTPCIGSRSSAIAPSRCAIFPMRVGTVSACARAMRQHLLSDAARAGPHESPAAGQEGRLRAEAAPSGPRGRHASARAREGARRAL